MGDLKDEGWLQKKIEGRVRRKIPDQVWLGLDTEYIEASVCGGEGAFDQLADEVLKLLRVYDAGAKTGTRPASSSLLRQRQDARPLLTLTENRIAELYAAEIRRKVDLDRGLVRFRNDFLGGEPLDNAAAESLLMSPAARFLPGKRFQEIGIPFLDHQSDVIEHQWALDRPGLLLRKMRIRIRASGVTHVEAINVPSHAVKSLSPPDSVRLSEDEQEIEVAPWSVMGALRDISEDIARTYLWMQADAAWYVLTGESPKMPAVEGEIIQRRRREHTDGRIVLTIRPWVSPQSVERSYRSLQKRMLGGRFRPVSDRLVQVWAFVDARAATSGKRPKWKWLWNLIRRRAPTRASSSWRNLARDYHRARAYAMPTSFLFAKDRLGQSPETLLSVSQNPRKRPGQRRARK